MESRSLKDRIEAEIHSPLSNPEDQLYGFFGRYRPKGIGLERVLGVNELERDVLARILKVFNATASSWTTRDWYFVIRDFEPIRRDSALRLAQKYIDGVRKLAIHVGDSDLDDRLAKLVFVMDKSGDYPTDNDVPIMIYECLGDFFGPRLLRHELSILESAVYSMTNDYSLMAYMLWPIVRGSDGLIDCLDSYFDIWRYGIDLEFMKNGEVLVKPGKLMQD